MLTVTVGVARALDMLTLVAGVVVRLKFPHYRRGDDHVEV
jgi:hypothetical protein